MKNDGKSTVLYDPPTRLETFYASGSRGTDIRADGNGGTLTRGYYGRTYLVGPIGPFSTRRKAWKETAYAHRIARCGE